MEEYTVNKNAKGEIVSVFRNGAQIPLEKDCQQFWDFRTWAWSQPREKVGYYSNCRPNTSYHYVKFFSDRTRFEDYCKSRGIMLYARPKDNVGEDRTFDYEVVFTNIKCLPFWPMHESVAINGSLAHPVHDGILMNPKAFAYVSESLFRDLCTELKDASSNIRKMSSWPIELTFVYIDVVSFSKYLPGQQALIINSLTSLVKDEFVFPEELFDTYEEMLCTGDGYIFVFKNPLIATEFAACLATRLEEHAANDRLPVEYHFRIGVNFGPVYGFWEPNRSAWNYIGLGINGGNRVLNAIGKDLADVVFVSKGVRKKLLAIENTITTDPDNDDYRSRATLLINNLQNRGTRFDKHELPWSVYELNHHIVSGFYE